MKGAPAAALYGSQAAENEAQYRALIDALGGEDNAGIRLWWDIGRNW